MNNSTGGPAFPELVSASGITLRDFFASVIPYDKEIMEDISRCDDQDLIERFGTEEEKDEYFDLVPARAPMPFKNIELRTKLEARGRAKLRYLEADAMISERGRP